MERLTQAINRLISWYCEEALPKWVNKGYDFDRGGFYECLDFDGAPVADLPRRVRAQARQIHTLSQAGVRGWHDGAEPLAARGFDFFLDRACPDDGRRGCAHLLTPDGSILDDTRDLYDQAFLLLACASRWEAAKDERALSLAESTIEFLDRELASPHGGWIENDKSALPRRQNPHMHVLEAFCALYRVCGNAEYLAYADRIVELFETKFFDPSNDVVIEFFDKLLERDAEQGDLTEPGHMAEWVWLLDGYQQLRGRMPNPIAIRLYNKVSEIGRDPRAPSFLVNACKIGEPPTGSRRLWPQTEYLKATIIQAKNGDVRAAALAAEIIEQLFETYFSVATPGLWCDEFDASGTPIAIDVPASIPYHLHEAVVCCESYLKAKT